MSHSCKEMDLNKDGSRSQPGIPWNGSPIPSSLTTSQWDWKVVDAFLNLVNQKRQCASVVNATLNHFSVDLSTPLIPWALVVQQKRLPKLVSPTLSLKELQGHGARLSFSTNLPRKPALCSHLPQAPLLSQWPGPSPLQSLLWKPLSPLLLLNVS